jgi:hypothetical protein
MEKQRGTLPDRPLIGLLPPASTSRKPKPVLTMVKPLNSEAHRDNFRQQPVTLFEELADRKVNE